MAMSLQEQLLKAGLTNEKKAKKAKKSSKKTREMKREVKAAAEEKIKQQQQRDKELNQQIQQQAREKEIQAQIKQLIEVNKLENFAGELDYNFTDGSAVKKLSVSETVQKQLANGRLSIVRLADDYVLVPSKVADKIAERDESILVAQNVVADDIDEDDPYKDYVIPDDLMW